MTGPIIPADQWPEWADRHCWDEDGDGRFYGQWAAQCVWKSDWSWSNIPMPAGHDWRVPVMRPTCKESLPVAPATDLAAAMLAHLVSSGVLGTDGRAYAELQAMIDGQANVRSSSEHCSEVVRHD